MVGWWCLAVDKVKIYKRDKIALWFFVVILGKDTFVHNKLNMKHNITVCELRFAFMYDPKCSTTFPWCTINAPATFAWYTINAPAVFAWCTNQFVHKVEFSYIEWNGVHTLGIWYNNLPNKCWPLLTWFGFLSVVTIAQFIKLPPTINLRAFDLRSHYPNIISF